MINSYTDSDAKAEDDGSMVVLPSSTDLFYFYRETLVQCARFSTGKTFRDLCELFAKHLVSYCNVVLLGGVSRYLHHTSAMWFSYSLSDLIIRIGTKKPMQSKKIIDL